MDFEQLEQMHEQITNEETQENPEFTIDTVELAEWALGKVNDEQLRFNIYEKATKSKIEMLELNLLKEKEKLERKTSYLKFKLDEYLDKAPAKKTKTKVSLVLPSGTISRVLPKLEFVSTCGVKEIKKDQNLIMYCKENAQDFIKTEETVAWGEFKKDLEIKDSVIIRKSTGEILDCLTFVETEPKFEVK